MTVGIVAAGLAAGVAADGITDVAVPRRRRARRRGGVGGRGVGDVGASESCADVAYIVFSANRWHPLAFDAQLYGFPRKDARSLFSHISGALPPPRLHGVAGTVPPPPTHPTILLFLFYQAALIMAINSSLSSVPDSVTCAVGSPPAIAGVRTGRQHRRRQQSPPGHCKRIRKVCGKTADPHLIHAEAPKGWMWLP